jgi:aspartate-semialdehyde dehydrogenase
MKRKVALLGATGAVGQRYIQLLENHPWFNIKVVAASKRSAGKKYSDACKWRLNTPKPESISDMMVVGTNLKEVKEYSNVDFVFSALPGGLAGPIEEEFAVEYPVISKASAHRMDDDVPLVIPEINPEHLGLIPIQKKNRGWNGFISTDPNCSTIQLAISLKPLMSFGLENVIVSTMQALSGAGYPGVPSLDIVDNVIPFISGEEDKMESEAKKILGKLVTTEIQPAKIMISATCNRVNVKDGHMETVYVSLADKPSVEEVLESFENFVGEPQKLELPSAPKNPIIVKKENDRPQPNIDRDLSKGMSIIIGRVRSDPVMSIKYVCLGHNTLRGAAGAGVLHAELMAVKGII